MFSPNYRKRAVQDGQVALIERTGKRYDTVDEADVDSSRIKYYLDNEKFYKGRHWSWVRDPAEPLMTANYCSLTVDKHARMLVGKSWELNAPEGLEWAAPYLNETFLLNSKNEFSFELAKMGGMTGDAFVYVSLALHDTYHIPYIKLTIIPSKYVRPIVIRNSIMGKKVVGYRVVYAEYDDSGHPTKYEIEFRKDATYYKIDGDVSRVVPNESGIIPFVFFRNLIIPGEVHGRSDLDDIVELNKTYNENFTSMQDAVRYYGNPYLFIFGARVSQLHRSFGKVYSIANKDARAEFLELENDLSLVMKAQDITKNILHELGNIPETSTGGKTPAISNTSSAALQTLFKPIVEIMDEKKTTYSSGLRNLCLLVLDFSNILYRKKGHDPDALKKIKNPEHREYLEKLGETSDPQFIANFSTMRRQDVAKIEIQFKEPFATTRLREMQELTILKNFGLLSKSIKLQLLRQFNSDDAVRELQELEAEEAALLKMQGENVPVVKDSDKETLNSVFKEDQTTFKTP